MSEPPAAEAVGITKAYGSRQALRSVSLRVRPGEIHGLMGPNGAGKTTLLRVLLGLTRADGGQATLFGKEPGAAVRLRSEGAAGFVGAPQFYPYLSARENLCLLTRLDGARRRALVDASRLEATLESVGLLGHADEKVRGYSAGMRQRLGLASALLRTPRLLLLDEPTSSLDPKGARDVHALFRRLAEGGTAIILSSHDVHEVEALCSSVTVLHRGCVAFSGEAAALWHRVAPAAQALKTSADDAARVLLLRHPGVQVASEPGEGLTLRADEPSLDAYVLALGREGIAVRSLVRTTRPLESLLLALPRSDETENAPCTTFAPTHHASPARGLPSPRGVIAVASVEWSKLCAQAAPRFTALFCVLGPAAFAVALASQSAVPDDTLFGRSVLRSGLAFPLLVLGFAAAWLLPAFASIVGGDLLPSEDRHGTWSLLCSRSRTLGELFLGKALSGLAFALAATFLLCVTSGLVGILVIGHQPLLSLSGTLLPATQAATRVVAAWASVAPPVAAFTALALLVSIATRSSAAGVALPVAIGLTMDAWAVLGGPEVVRRLLPTAAFTGWHGLLAQPPFYGPLLEGAGVSLGYTVACLTAGYVLLRRRERTG